MVAGVAEFDALLFATVFSDRASAGQGLDLSRRGKSLPMVAEFDQQTGGQQFTGARQGTEDEGLGVLGKQLSELTERLAVSAHLGQELHLRTLGLHHGRLGGWPGSE